MQCTAREWYIHANENNEILYRNEYMRIVVVASGGGGMRTLAIQQWCSESAQMYTYYLYIYSMYVIEVAISCLKAIIMVQRFWSGAQRDAKWISALIQMVAAIKGNRQEKERKTVEK